MAEMPEWLAIVPHSACLPPNRPRSHSSLSELPHGITATSRLGYLATSRFHYIHSVNIGITATILQLHLQYVTLCELKGPWLRKFYTPIGPGPSPRISPKKNPGKTSCASGACACDWQPKQSDRWIPIVQIVEIIETVQQHFRYLLDSSWRFCLFWIYFVFFPGALHKII